MDKWLPFIFGFAGIVVGSASSIITLMVQLKANERRENTRLACELAKQDQHLAFEIVKYTKKPFALFPLSSFIHFHTKLIEAIASNKLDEEMIEKIANENWKFNDVIEKITKMRKEQATNGNESQAD